jgi:hypothetical protein
MAQGLSKEFIAHQHGSGWMVGNLDWFMDRQGDWDNDFVPAEDSAVYGTRDEAAAEAARRNQKAQR